MRKVGRMKGGRGRARKSNQEQGRREQVAPEGKVTQVGSGRLWKGECGSAELGEGECE